jgi:hypothetical protein
MTTCFCTLAIHEAYRRRARTLCSDLPHVPWVILTDQPEDFDDLPVRAIRHTPTGPMAVDYVKLMPSMGNAAPAYHDRRFVLQAALEDFDAAVHVDADARLIRFPELGTLPGGLLNLPPAESIAEHLAIFGSWRIGIFEELARYLIGDAAALQSAQWVKEGFYVVAKDGRETRFFEAWDRAVHFMQSREVYSGEGGVMGLAALSAGWTVNYDAVRHVAGSIHQENCGAKYISPAPARGLCARLLSRSRLRWHRSKPRIQAG